MVPKCKEVVDPLRCTWEVYQSQPLLSLDTVLCESLQHSIATVFQVVSRSRGDVTSHLPSIVDPILHAATTQMSTVTSSTSRPIPLISPSNTCLNTHKTLLSLLRLPVFKSIGQQGSDDSQFRTAQVRLPVANLHQNCSKLQGAFL